MTVSFGSVASWRKGLVVLGLAILMGGAAMISPAMAQEGDHRGPRHEHWGPPHPQRWHERRHYEPVYAPPPVIVPQPRVVYAPPPMVAPPSGINIILPINIR